METFVGRHAGKFILSQLFNAKSYACICSPYISEYYAKAVSDLARKRVSIQLITCTKQTERDFYPVAYFKGFEREVKKNDLPFSVIAVHESFIHAKLYVVDDSFAVIGSANLTTTGMWKSVESIVTFREPKEVLKLKNAFEKIWDYNTATFVQEPTYEAPKEEEGIPFRLNKWPA